VLLNVSVKGGGRWTADFSKSADAGRVIRDEQRGGANSRKRHRAMGDIVSYAAQCG
jgi:hypothetical protein